MALEAVLYCESAEEKQRSSKKQVRKSTFVFFALHHHNEIYNYAPEITEKRCLTFHK